MSGRGSLAVGNSHARETETIRMTGLSGGHGRKNSCFVMDVVGMDVASVGMW